MTFKVTCALEASKADRNDFYNFEINRFFPIDHTSFLYDPLRRKPSLKIALDFVDGDCVTTKFEAIPLLLTKKSLRKLGM